jgi:hypothetical protein
VSLHDELEELIRRDIGSDPAMLDLLMSSRAVEGAELHERESAYVVQTWLLAHQKAILRLAAEIDAMRGGGA